MAGKHTPHVATQNPAGSACDPSQWVERYGDTLLGYVMLQVQDQALAEELVQETFLAALQAREQFDRRSSERTWLVGILKHKIVDQFRRSGRQRAAGGLSAEDDPLDEFFDRKGRWKRRPVSWTPDPSALAENLEFWAAFEHCFNTLPERLSEVFALRIVNEAPADDVCKVLAISSTNLWVMLHRARTRLRDCLERTWFKSDRDSYAQLP